MICDRLVKPLSQSHGVAANLQIIKECAALEPHYDLISILIQMQTPSWYALWPLALGLPTM